MRRSRPLLAASLAVAVLAFALAPPAAGQEISFSGAAWYPVGVEPHDLALGDFDGDGILDAVTANLVSNTLTVRRGDGIGGLRPPIEIPVGDGPIFFATGHLNADPFCDLVVTHLNADGTWILLADGTGGFAPPVAFDPDFPAIPALVDLNLDGALDLVLATSFTGRVRSFLGDGAGGFGPEVGTGTVPPLPTRIRSVLLDADPWPDFLVLDVHSGLYAFLGSGSGTFPTRQYLGSYPSAHDLEVAQLNAAVDTHLDVVISGYDSYRLTYLFGNGAGGFTSVLQGIPFRATDLAVGDWNGDGLADLAVGSLDTGTRTFHGDGSGGFILASSSQWPPVDLRVMAGLTTADLDLDGRPDLISPDYYGERLVTSLNDGTGGFTAGRTFPAGNQPRSLAVAPFDAVPGPDLLVGSYSQGAEPERGFRLLSNLGSGLFGPFTHFAPAGAGALIGTAAGDLDGDGDQDAVFAALTSPPRVGVALGDGAGDFPDWSLLDPAMSPWAVELGQFDLDPWPDLAVHGRQGVNGVALLAGDGAGGFGAPTFYAGAGANATVGFAVADLDGDGFLDVAHPNSEAASLTVRFGDGLGALGAAVTYGVTGMTNDVAAGDLDGDLDLDLVVVGDRISILRQEPARSFALHQEIVPDFRLHQAVLADFDGDGDLDLAVVGVGGSILAYANAGTGTFSGPTRFGIWYPADSLAAEDLDGDGLPDLVATLYHADRVIVLRNNLRRLADLAVVVDDGQVTAVPGEAVSYTVTVTNLGPALVRELSLPVLDTPPLLSPVFTPGEGSYTPATGGWTGLELRHGESVTLTLEGTIDPWVTGTQTVSATVVAPAAVSDPIAANNTSWDEDVLTPVTDLGLAKSDGQTSAVAGLPVTYTLTVTNHGPSAAPALTLLDPPPALLLTPVFTPERG
ncbi:MAG TPA: FG-GAP-like repeat-containing protein, partial [Thermoanaerobaculia bacterium]|nr:FG-GAP-like repeat-containing protein [Thermoanaerobaculia bacterium]